MSQNQIKLKRKKKNQGITKILLYAHIIYFLRDRKSARFKLIIPVDIQKIVLKYWAYSTVYKNLLEKMGKV